MSRLILPGFSFLFWHTIKFKVSEIIYSWLRSISSRSSMLSFQKRQLYSQTITNQRYAYKDKYDIFPDVGIGPQSLESNRLPRESPRPLLSATPNRPIEINFTAPVITKNRRVVQTLQVFCRGWHELAVASALTSHAAGSWVQTFLYYLGSPFL